MELLTLAQVEERTGIARRTLKSHAMKGILPAELIGKQYIVMASIIPSYLNKLQNKATQAGRKIKFSIKSENKD